MPTSNQMLFDIRYCTYPEGMHFGEIHLGKKYILNEYIFFSRRFIYMNNVDFILSEMLFQESRQSLFSYYNPVEQWCAVKFRFIHQ
jgi:hypothetical protein